MTEPSDEDLIARAREGDEQAFAGLVERHHRPVFRLILRTVGERARAEELAQEVFLRAFRGLRYFRGQARFSTWIHRIAVNLCLQERRTPPTVPLETPDGWERRPIDPGRDDAAFGTLELRDRLSKALARLPAQERVLVAGHYLHGVGYERLAEALNLPLGTVKTQLFRAKAKLRRMLEEGL
jgi:RNA polymerase sigma-70 factor (ECF subfamily)